MVDLASLITVGGMGTFLMLLAQFAKLYLPERYKPAIPWALMALGVVLTPLFALATGVAGTGPLVSYAVGGVFAGLTATGIYQATIDPIKALRNPTPLPIPPLPPRG